MHEKIRAATQNNLAIAIHADGDLETLKVAVQSLGKTGGTVNCVIPGEHVTHADMRSDVEIKIVERCVADSSPSFFRSE